MGKSLAHKLIESHLVEGRAEAGQEIGLRVDQTLTQDATGTMAYLAFEAMGIPRVKTELSVSYIDHNLLQTDFKNADDHRFLQSAAAKYGVLLSPAGNGICHHVHKERFGVPGKLLLGSDSHTTTGGCLGMLAMGAGGLDVALAMAGKPFHIIMPKIWGVHLTGKLPAWVSGKDVMLELLRQYSVKGGLGYIMEFYGPGVENLDMSARGTITNMGVDIGATAAIFPSDKITKEYLHRQQREQDWVLLQADAEAKYDQVTELDLSTLVPLVACPSSPDNVKPASELGDVELSQVIVGACTNGDYRDVMMTGQIVKGKQKYSALSFDINCGSRETAENVTAAGGLLDLMHAGARVHQPGCLGCIGVGQVPPTGSNSLRTFPRNYKGRSGSKDDHIYLCSPETAAASVLKGRITDPRTLEMDYPKITYPDIFEYNKDWFIEPAPKGTAVELLRGPNIKPFPRFEAMAEDLEGEILLKLGDNISTDQIMPAGNRVLPLRSNIGAMSEFVFDVEDETFPQRAKEKGGGIIVGGDNYGQGSSREHAALVPRYLGVRAKIAKSFARIHKANLINYGIVPLRFIKPDDIDAIKQGQSLRIPGLRGVLVEGKTEVKAFVDKLEIPLALELTERDREILVAGGALNWASGG